MESLPEYTVTQNIADVQRFMQNSKLAAIIFAADAGRHLPGPSKKGSV